MSSHYSFQMNTLINEIKTGSDDHFTVNKITNSVNLKLNSKQICDLELLLNGGFSPLFGFMSQKDYESVLTTMRLENGLLCAMPITLDLSMENSYNIHPDQDVILCDLEGTPLAILHVTDRWVPDKNYESLCVFGTIDSTHPGVNYLLNKTGEIYIGGSLTLLCLPKHYDFKHFRLSPLELKKRFKKLGWEKIIAFQTRNPMHRAHFELTLMASQNENAKLLIHPVVGVTKPGDIDYLTRIRCYEKTLQHYPENHATLSLLPLAMRMAGPREALWHALIRKNYGCTHFIVGRDHAGPGCDKNGEPFYAPYEAQALLLKHQEEIGIKILPFSEMVYDKKQRQYLLMDQILENSNIAQISGTQFRKMLRDGDEIPTWFSFPDVIAELRKAYPPKYQQGFTLFLTGLSGAGKSTIANILAKRLHEYCADRAITLLDGDIVRTLLSSKLGFSKEDRDLNIHRIAFVASEITRHKGIVICAPIAPYDVARCEARKMINLHGGFFEIYINTPLSVCRMRDPKGLYKKVDAGIIKNFTGVDDPYEVPMNPDIEINTIEHSAEEAAEKIIQVLCDAGYVK